MCPARTTSIFKYFLHDMKKLLNNIISVGILKIIWNKNYFKKTKSAVTYLHMGGSNQGLGHRWTDDHSTLSHSTNGNNLGKWHGDACTGTQAQDSC